MSWKLRSLLSALAVFAATAVAREPIRHAPALEVPVAPVVVNVAGTRHLVHELHATNFRPQPMTLARIDIEDADSGAVLASYAGDELAKRLGRPGVATDAPREIGGGLRAVLYGWQPLAANAAPARVRHRVFYRHGPEAGEGVVSDRAVDVRDDAVVLGPPLRGGPWIALYEPTMVGGHRTAIYAVDGRARIPARFAIDWVRVDDEGRRARGDVELVANHHGFGADVLAVADALVADVRDDVPDAVDSSASRGAMRLEQASGNYVVLDLGDGRFAFYEHLKHGSVRVRVGDRVARGAVIAALGNTGSSSSGPHLHFHVADAPSTLAAEGRAWTLDAFTVVGGYPDLATAESGRRWDALRDGEGGQRRGEMPAPNAVVVFAGEGATSSEE